MTHHIANEVTGILVSDGDIVSLAELCRCCSLPAEELLILVEYGIIEPLELGEIHSRWQFTGHSVLRVQTALRLQRDLGINPAGVALALDLLDEIKTLRRLSVAAT